MLEAKLRPRTFDPTSMKSARRKIKALHTHTEKQTSKNSSQTKNEHDRFYQVTVNQGGGLVGGKSIFDIKTKGNGSDVFCTQEDSTEIQHINFVKNASSPCTTMKKSKVIATLAANNTASEQKQKLDIASLQKETSEFKSTELGGRTVHTLTNKLNGRRYTAQPSPRRVRIATHLNEPLNMSKVLFFGQNGQSNALQSNLLSSSRQTKRSPRGPKQQKS